VLVLRNSFLIVEPKWKERIQKLSFQTEDFFQHGDILLRQLVQRDSANKTTLNGSAQEVEQVYDLLRRQALSIDSTLEKHVEALKAKTMYRLQELEKKMLRAEKRKFTDQQRQIQTIREQLFPGNGLQERKDNLLYYYAQYGPDFIQALYNHSLGLEQEFVILSLS
jgi:bacillithiol synthase